MRIIIVSQHFWPETMPINEVAVGLARLGAEVCVLTGKPNYPDGRIFSGYRARGVTSELWQDIQIYRVPIVPRGHGRAMRLALNYASFIVSAATFGRRAIPWVSADIILVFGTSPFLQALAGVALARAKRARLVTWVQDLWPEGLAATGFVRPRSALAAVGLAVNWIYRRADLIMVQSAAMVMPVRERAGGRPVEVFSTPGPFSSVSPPPTQLKLPPGFNIVFAGNLGQVQALWTVMQAAEQLRDLINLRFVIVGSGRLSGVLARAVDTRGLNNVLLAGRYAPEEMPAIFAQADALLLTLAPGAALAMTVPSKLAHYLAAGRPILAAVDGEAARIVRESGAGEPITAGNAAGLALAVRKLLTVSPEQRSAQGASARRYYEQHLDPERLIPALLARLDVLAHAPT